MPEIAPAGNEALRFCLNLNRATAVLTRHIDNRLGALHGLSLNDLTVLQYLHLAPHGKARRSDLAAHLGLTASAVTRLLLPLEKIGLVARLPDARDARVGYAALTSAGGDLLKVALESAVQTSEDLVGHVPVAQLRALSTVLDSLV
ncbi:MarR family winged helix-turn-helix transcriptional regulator [Deinococcus humi]|uniref:DNA-binding MarR family transcriptional regulator n=1 Tax=Deinococcus humi TaxID=662880 RepID=A0A7W8NEW9_9DEIO|nr:MarR family winged helix-turn-helix transcriptional regulator [Deinococcus humi]MBB5363781.1 DNA-binding MarR family transcriptional regulator [Deinococcus humi]GGO32027.1 hypothetical protein GCM10008949_28900 [Deinococcus humi]